MYSSLPSLDLATADLYDIALLYTVKPNPSKLAHMAAIIPYKDAAIHLNYQFRQKSD